MDYDLRVVPTIGIVRFLKSFAMRLGLDEDLADAAAQLHLQQNPALIRWHAFMVDNCGSCALRPDSCPYLNPQPQHCAGGATSEGTRIANMLMLESGRTTRCPTHRESV
jgi:hypothetical protein